MNYCTVASCDNLCQAVTLADSLISHTTVRKVFVLLIGIRDLNAVQCALHPRIQVVSVAELGDDPDLALINRRYYRTLNLNAYICALKSILLRYVLHRGKGASVYVDADVYFFSAPDYLLNVISSYSVALCPLHQDITPGISSEGLDAVLKEGYFTSSLIGVGPTGLPFVDWWAQCCAFRCEDASAYGAYFDQRYLDAVPYLFDGVRVIDQLGYNLGQWNVIKCKREAAEEGNVVINGAWPIVNIHFSPATCQFIRDGRDTLLEPYLALYESHLFRNRAVLAGCLQAQTKIESKSIYNLFMRLFRRIMIQIGVLFILTGKRAYNFGKAMGTK